MSFVCTKQHKALRRDDNCIELYDNCSQCVCDHTLMTNRELETERSTQIGCLFWLCSRERSRSLNYTVCHSSPHFRPKAALYSQTLTHIHTHRELSIIQKGLVFFDVQLLKKEICDFMYRLVMKVDQAANKKSSFSYGIRQRSK